MWEAQWERGDPLEGGAQGRPYLARRRSSSGEYTHILKELRNQSDKGRRRRMSFEVSALQVLDHPRVAKLADSNTQLWDSEEPLYVVMDRVAGRNVAEVRRAVEHVALDKAVTFALRLLEAVEYCHSRGVVHRDIKPENVVLVGDDWENPVLIDFGLSFNKGLLEQHATRESEAMGNKFLVLPEQASDRGAKREPATDVTQCAGMLYYAIVGRAPFVLLDQSGKAPHEREEYRQAVARLEPATEKRLSQFFAASFPYPLAARIQSAQAAASALRSVIAAGGSMADWNFAQELEQLKELPKHVGAEAFLKSSTGLLNNFETICAGTVSKIEISLQSAWTFRSGTLTKDLQGCVITFRWSMASRKDQKQKLDCLIKGALVGTEFVATYSGTEFFRTAFSVGGLDDAFRLEVEKRTIAALQEFLGRAT